ncbi:hypothetical protein SFC43_22335 [Bacteroides sp. CR5/BHMF/2]|nr:hypothetical protein [Bacteroides sp. CR5/BHMF/2]
MECFEFGDLSPEFLLRLSECRQVFQRSHDGREVFASKDYCDNWLAGVYAYLSKNNMMDVGSKGAALHNFADDMFLEIAEI